MVAESTIGESSVEVEKYNVTELERMNRLGKGGFCNVFLVNTRRNGVLKRVAMKELHLEGINTQHEFQEAAKDLIQEAQILQQVHHSNIVGLRGISDVDPNKFLSSLGNSGTYFILLDVMLETLEERLNRWYDEKKSWKHKASTRLSFRKAELRRLPKEVCRKRMMERIRTVVMDVANAMEYLHNHNIIFQDLKPENIGFEIETDELKIFDFGMARSVDPATGNIVGEEEEMICGTPRYFAPEIFDFSGGSKRTDVYAFGIMLHEICSMSVPFSEMHDFEEFRDHICAGGRPNVWDIPDEATRQVIRDCTTEDPAARPSFSDLRAFRLPELLLEKKQLESPRSSLKPKIGDSNRTPDTEVGSCNYVGPLDMDDHDELEVSARPQEIDIVPKRRSASNQSMPRMRQSGFDDLSVNSRELGRSTHSANSDFLPHPECMPSDRNLTKEQKQRRKERAQRSLARKKKPRRRKLKNDERQQEQHQSGKRRLRRSMSGLADIHDRNDGNVAGPENRGHTAELDKPPLIPQTLSCDADGDDDEDSFANNTVSLDGDDDNPSLNDYTISLNDKRSTVSRSNDDRLELTKDVKNLTEEIPLPPPPPPPLPMQSPRPGGLDNSSHGTKKKRRMKKKGMDLSSHSAFSRDTVSLDDDIVLYTAEDQPPPPPSPPSHSAQLSAGTPGTRNKKTRKGTGLSSHSVCKCVSDDDAALEASQHSDGLTPRTRRRKKTKGGKKKDVILEHTNKLSPNAPNVGFPEKSRSKTPKSRTRRENKLEMELESRLSLAVEDPLPFRGETSSAMMKKSETCGDLRPQDLTMLPREFSWWKLKDAQ